MDIKDLALRLKLPEKAMSLYVTIIRCGKIEQKLVENKDDANWLLKHGFIFEYMDENDKTWYVPVDPEIVALSLSYNYKWSKGVLGNSTDGLNNRSLIEINTYESYCKDFSKLLKNVHKRANIEGVFYVRGSDEFGTLLSNIIASAQRSIFGVVTPRWLPKISLVWASLVNKMREGVPYYRVSDYITFLAFGYKINKRDIYDVGVKLKVIPSRIVSQKFFLVDNKVALIFWKEKFGKFFSFEGTFIDNPGVLKMLIKTKERLLKLGIDGHECLKCLREIRESYLLNAREVLRKEDKLKFLEKIFDYGVFFLSGVNFEKYYDLLEELTKRGLIKPLGPEYLSYGGSAYIPAIEKEFMKCLKEMIGDQNK